MITAAPGPAGMGITHSDPQRWRIPPDLELHFRSWDEEFIVYNSGSGDTHLLTALAAEILLALQESPAAAADLSRRVAASFNTEPDPQFVLTLEKVLADLGGLGLAERIKH